jgi:hypothetical protein
MAQVAEQHQRPGWFTTNVFNRAVAVLTRLGASVYGSRVLEVRGRHSGEWRQTPVNLLSYEGAEYVVVPRGHTHDLFERHLREVLNASRDLGVGRRREPQRRRDCVWISHSDD